MDKKNIVVMATIKELAKEYAAKNPIYSYDADTGEVEKHTEEVEAIYEDSAKEMLSEIENYIYNEIQMKDLDEPHLILHSIQNKIKELKLK